MTEPYCDDHKACLKDIGYLKEWKVATEAKLDKIYTRINVTLASIAVSAILLLVNVLVELIKK